MSCIHSVGISSCLRLCCRSISFSVDLCSFSQKRLVLEIWHTCRCVLASSSGQTTLESFLMKVSTNEPPSILLVSDVVQRGLPSCPSQHSHFAWIEFALIILFSFYGEVYVIADMMIILKTLSVNSTGTYQSHIRPTPDISFHFIHRIHIILLTWSFCEPPSLVNSDPRMSQ